MDFSAKLENLQAKVNETVETARAAAAENRDQLKQRVDKAEDNAKQAMQDAKQQAEQTADRAKSKWAQMKADAAAQREDMKAKINKRADQLDAKAAALMPTGPSRMQPTPSTTPSTLSLTRSWPCSTRWTRGPTHDERAKIAGT
jgi:ABC-type transporter Mla subunit MlaD